jgi:peptidoglycan/LPS O-acetylase OafA/YrhL
MTLARQTVDGGWAWSGAMMGFVRALSGFAGGVLVSRLVRWLALPAQGGAKQAAIVAAAASGVIAAGYVAFCPEALGGAELAIVLIGFPTLVCGLALTRSPWMENRLGDVLGGASYSIYLLHTIVIEIVELALKRAHIAGSPLQGLAWMSAIIGLSYVCWRRFETPARIWAQRLPLPTFSARAASPAGRA